MYPGYQSLKKVKVGESIFYFYLLLSSTFILLGSDTQGGLPGVQLLSLVGVVGADRLRFPEDRRILFLSNQRICYVAVRPIRSLEMTMDYAGVRVILQK